MNEHRLTTTSTILGALSIFLVLLLAGLPARAGERPLWWDDMQKEADAEGYELVDEDELAAISEKPDALLLDVRPDYEFEQGHIPGAVNYEFDLGDRMIFHREERERFAALVGDDKDRPILIYCRSFR